MHTFCTASLIFQYFVTEHLKCMFVYGPVCPWLHHYTASYIQPFDILRHSSKCVRARASWELGYTLNEEIVVKFRSNCQTLQHPSWCHQHIKVSISVLFSSVGPEVMPLSLDESFAKICVHIPSGLLVMHFHNGVWTIQDCPAPSQLTVYTTSLDKYLADIKVHALPESSGGEQGLKSVKFIF